MVKFEEMTGHDDDDESEKQLEARHRRYLCLIYASATLLTEAKM